MAKISPGQETLEFAISREVEAYHFYLALAGRVKSRQMRKVFEDLAKEELEHKAKLELEVIKTGRPVSTKLKPGRPESDYIISDDPSQLDIDYKDMLLLGMEKEESSFRIYVNLAAKACDEESREVLLSLAEEEVKHKLRFENEYELLVEKDPTG
jgi:rubrerythrin